MKTPEEIRKELTTGYRGSITKKDAENMMRAYHAQFEQETCKWVDSISNPKYSVSTCENVALPIKELYKYGVKYCPFCGRKIERI